MNPKTLKEAKTQFLEIKKAAAASNNVDAGIAAPYVFLPELGKNAGAALFSAAQNIAAEKEGPFTGEVSADMLLGCKVKYAIIGHSERRALGESNDLIRRKIQVALRAKIVPVLCVGELERDSGMWYLGAVKTQIEESLAGLPKAAVKNVVIAYEPVWAISSTAGHKDATPHDFEEMRIYIQKVLVDLYGPAAGEAVILYGGSVDEKNAASFVKEGGADGLLVGRASLNPKKFAKILSSVNAIN